MTRLSRLLRVLGADELGRRLGRSASTVRRWKGKAPRAVQDDLRAIEKRRQAARAAARAREEKRRAKERAKEARAEKRRRTREDRTRADRETREALERGRKEENAKRERLEAEERARSERAKKKLEEERLAGEARVRARAEEKRRAQEAKAKKEKENRVAREALAKQKAEEEKKRSRTEAERRIGIVAKACLVLETNTAIAQAIGVDEATIRRWMTKPPLKGQAFERLEEMVETVQVFVEMMKLAGETGNLPVVRPSQGERSGRRTEGYYWTRVVMQSLTPDTIRTIVGWIRKHSGQYPYWQAAVVTSQYSLVRGGDFDDYGPKQTDRGYKTVYVNLTPQDDDKKHRWGDFAVERVEPSAETRSPGGCARDIAERLQRRIDSGEVQVFVHGVTLFAYRRRSEKEQRSWVTSERQERRERWEQKMKESGKRSGRARKMPRR